MSTWELKENSTGLLSVTVDGEKWADAQKKHSIKLLENYLFQDSVQEKFLQLWPKNTSVNRKY